MRHTKDEKENTKYWKAMEKQLFFNIKDHVLANPTPAGKFRNWVEIDNLMEPVGRGKNPVDLVQDWRSLELFEQILNNTVWPWWKEHFEAKNTKQHFVSKYVKGIINHIDHTESYRLRLYNIPENNVFQMHVLQTAQVFFTDHETKRTEGWESWDAARFKPIRDFKGLGKDDIAHTVQADEARATWMKDQVDTIQAWRNLFARPAFFSIPIAAKHVRDLRTEEEIAERPLNPEDIVFAMPKANTVTIKAMEEVGLQLITTEGISNIIFRR